MKICYQIVVGNQEIDTNTIKIRKYGSSEQESMSIDDFIQKISFEVTNKVR